VIRPSCAHCAQRLSEIFTKLLDMLQSSVRRRESPNDSMASLARDLLQAVAARRTLVKERYRVETVGDAELLEAFRAFDRTAF